jgi:hypothetical protein
MNDMGEGEEREEGGKEKQGNPSEHATGAGHQFDWRFTFFFRSCRHSDHHVAMFFCFEFDHAAL